VCWVCVFGGRFYGVSKGPSCSWRRLQAVGTALVGLTVRASSASCACVCDVCGRRRRKGSKCAACLRNSGVMPPRGPGSLNAYEAFERWHSTWGWMRAWAWLHHASRVSCASRPFNMRCD
jgi:hypothetical protein